jgi:hypothetical protein
MTLLRELRRGEGLTLESLRCLDYLSWYLRMSLPDLMTDDGSLNEIAREE